MSPAKIAMAAVVTITASAGTGAMKNVTGTSSAIAIAAVRPGTAPTKRPKSDDATIRKITYGSASSFSAAKTMSMALPDDAFEQAARQRHAQEARERDVDE